MAKDTESDEDEIWNYRSTRSQCNSQQENTSGKTSVVARSKFGLTFNKDNQKREVSESKNESLLVLPANTEEKEVAGPAETIDIDLLDDNEFERPRAPMSRKIISKWKQTNRSTKLKHGAKTVSASAVNKSAHRGNKSSVKAGSETKLVGAKVRKTSKNRGSKKAFSSSSLSSLGKLDTPHCVDIHRYFSPTRGRKQNKRKSSESVESLCDFTDDELMVLCDEKFECVSKAKPEVNESCNTQTEANSESCITQIKESCNTQTEANSESCITQIKVKESCNTQTEDDSQPCILQTGVNNESCNAQTEGDTKLCIIQTEVNNESCNTQTEGDSEPCITQTEANNELHNIQVDVNNESCNTQSDKKYASTDAESSLSSKVSYDSMHTTAEENQENITCDVTKDTVNCCAVVNSENGKTMNQGQNINSTDSQPSSTPCKLDQQMLSDAVDCDLLVFGQSCGITNSFYNYTLRDSYEFQTSSSSGQSSDNKEFKESVEDIASLASIDSSVCAKSQFGVNDDETEIPEESQNINEKSEVAQENALPRSEDASCLLLATARKQTSINAYFKPKFQPVSKTSKSFSNKLSSNSSHSKSMLSSFSKSSAKPSLYRRVTVANPSPSLSTRNDPKQSLTKSASDAAVGQQSHKMWQEELQDSASNKRQCPFYKKIAGTSITVDAFSYGVIPGCEAYILTHFHSDHYSGLGKRFAQPLYCSQVTANLVEHRLKVDRRWIHPLQMWKPCQVAGVTVTFMEANHCPGSAIVLFELKDGRKVLHTGDFRACPKMEEYPALKGVTVSELYLDTTYCDPSRTFPSQEAVINFVVSLVQKYVTANPKTLIVCGTYTIGKEKIFTAIAKAINSKICVAREKKAILDCLDDPELQSMVTSDFSHHQVHVIPMFKLNQKALFEHHQCYPQFDKILAFKPTGWTHSEKKASLENMPPEWSRNGVTLYGVPYSEHSSFLELERFVQFLRPKRIIPTVNNGSYAQRKKMEDIFAQWMQCALLSPSRTFAPSHQGRLNSWIS